MAKKIFTWFKKKPAYSLKEALAASRFSALKQNITEAMRFLRKTHIKSLFYRQKLPWYLVIGSANTGKTSLFANSGLELISTNQASLQPVTTTTYCQWFFGKNAVFIDTAGELMLPKHMDVASLNLWKKFITLLYRRRHFHPLNGLILCIDLLELQDKSFEQRRQYIDVLLHHIHSFSYPIPIYVLFTRCDRIRGFTEFFQALTTEEREQICGVTLPLIDQQNFAQQLEKQFNAFLVRLNQQILGAMHQERNLEKRIQIKNFPLQLEAQKRTIIQLNSQLHSTKNPIKGIYFTSSQQEGLQNDALTPLLETFGFPAEPNISDRPLQKNAFFIKNTLLEIVQHKETARFVTPTQKWFGTLLYSFKFYPILGGSFIILLLLLLTGYFYNQQAIYRIHSILAEYQNQQLNPKQDPLSLLSTLNKGQNEVKYAANPVTGLIFHQAKNLKIQLDNLYTAALNSSFAPKLAATLEQQLQTEIEKKAPTLFNTLKIYLMLADIEHRDLKFIDNWFAAHLTNAALQNNQAFMHHLHVFLASKSLAFKTNPKLVGLARETLHALSPTDLAYANLQQRYSSAPSKNPTLSPLYAAKNFQAVLQQEIPSIASQTVKNDAWVLGEAAPSNLVKPLTTELTQDLQQLYITRYVASWMSQLSKPSVPPFKDIKEARLFMATLNTDHSLLLEPLRIIEKNLAPVAATSEGKKALLQLQKNRELLTKNPFNEKTKEAIKNLIAYLDELLVSKNSEATVFSATQKRIHNHEKDALTQLLNVAKEEENSNNLWLKQLALNTWQAMLLMSQNYLNAMWQHTVLPIYNAQILNRYPVFTNAAASNEIDLNTFGEFFGPHGVMETFFKQNIAPFVDTSTLYWQWKTVDGLQLNIPQNTLEMFNRAAMIRKMYFATEDKTPAVKFSLTPTNLELMSDNFVLHLGNQLISYSTDFRQARHFTWPNKKSNHAALEKQTGNEKQVFYEEVGDWAVFKLLSHASLASSHNPQLYQLTFDVHGQQVIYEVLADDPVNAFIPAILTTFRCPERL